MTRTLLATCVGLALSACVTADSPLAPRNGQFAAENFAAHVVDPTPAPGAPELDPLMAAAAVERYREDEVKDPYEGEGNQALTLGFTPGGSQ